jgi:hypothetical protein
MLSLLLVFSQLGAVLHEIGHLSHADRGATPALTAQQPADSTCPTCEAYAQVANPASGSAHALAACASVFLAIPAPPCVFLGADTPTPRSRGPPQA